MKRSRFTEEQIAFALKQAELGTKIDEVCRKLGISDATFYKWRQKYGGQGHAAGRAGKKALKPSRKRELAADLMDRFGASMRKACAVIQLSRVVYLYQSTARDSSALVLRMKEITQTRVHYSYRRVHVMLRREGFRDNHKRVYRLYREQGWSLRQKRPKRSKAPQLRQPKKLAMHINQIWCMDFVADNLFDGRKLRMLTVVDCFTRESLDIHVDQSLKGEDVVRVLNNIVRTRGKPLTIKTDNGSEFISKVMDKWAYERGIEMDFSRPGKPTDNAMVESFNGCLRQECLNEHWFMSLQDARTKIETWRRFYNETRPHSALDWQTPKEFALKNGFKPVLQINNEPELLTYER